MKTLRHSLLVLTLAASLTSGSCGGGATFGGGIGGTGLVIGTITDFGSIVVEGVEFDTSAAIVTIDGQPAAATDLALGMVVTVSGEIDATGTAGVADTVEFTSLLEGPVSAVDVTAKTATILGQTVRVDADTVLDRIAPDASAIGVPVRVSGFIDGDGTIHATRISRRPAGRPLVITGTVRRLDNLARRFRVRGIEIDFSSAVIDAIPPGGLRDGLLARVTLVASPANSVVQALRVQFIEPPVDRVSNVEVRVAGFVSALDPPRQFVLNELATVRVVADTVFVGGTASDVALNVKLAVVGRLTKERVVVARRIVFL